MKGRGARKEQPAKGGDREGQGAREGRGVKAAGAPFLLCPPPGASRRGPKKPQAGLGSKKQPWGPKKLGALNIPSTYLLNIFNVSGQHFSYPNTYTQLFNSFSQNCCLLRGVSIGTCALCCFSLVVLLTGNPGARIFFRIFWLLFVLFLVLCCFWQCGSTPHHFWLLGSLYTMSSLPDDHF